MKLILAIALFILCLIKRKSKIVLLITMFGLWFLMSHCGETLDSNNYINEFNRISLSNAAKEPLYVLFVYSFKALGFQYETYYSVSSALVILILGFTVYNLAENYNLVLGLFLIYPFPLYCVTRRNCFAYCICMIGIVFLNKTNDSKNINSWFRRNKYEIIYASFIIGASLIHSAYIVFLVFLFAEKMDIYKVSLVTIITIAIESVFLNKTILLKIAELFNIRSRLEYALYLQSLYGQSDISFRIIITAIIYIAFLSYLLYRLKNKYDFEQSDDFSIYYQNQLAIKLNIACLVILPIVPLAREIFRIQEALMLYNYIVITNNMDSQITWRKDTFRNWLMIASLLVFIVFDDYLYVLRFPSMIRNAIYSVFG